LSLNLHRMQLPREIIVGNGSLSLINDVCKNLGFIENVMIVADPTTNKVAGQKVANLLQEDGMEVKCYIVSSGIATMDDVKVTEQEIRKLHPQVVLGVGGGTIIDIAKLSSARRGVPFLSIPTTASHDGITSPFASIKGLERPYSIKAQAPMAVVMDTAVIIGAPYRFMASGCADVISKLTSTRDWHLAHLRRQEYYAQYSANLALMSAQHIVENTDLIKPSSEDGLRVLLEALISCGVAMCTSGTSRPCSGSEHLFCHALDLIAPKPAMHGEQCGLGAIMMAWLHGMEWETIREALKKVKAPVSAYEAELDTDHIVEALVKAPEIRPERYTILNEKPLTRKTAYELAKKTGVIE
jgi:glycerol-1-phosphate dehydrogenase [NAD(P)+]